MKPTRIVIMAKAPVAGLCKTRLIPALGAQGAAQLAHRMLLHTVHTALAANVGTVELSMSPGPDAFDWAALGLPSALHVSDQGSGDLGERMARAAQRAGDAAEAIVLIGTDCPALTSEVLQQAANALQDHEASLVPTADGGYALLGLQRFAPSLFEAMPWSTDAVCSLTRQRIQQLGWRLCSLPTLHDIDEPHDLVWLPSALQTDLPPAFTSASP
jgi:uncharacterized protein